MRGSRSKNQMLLLVPRRNVIPSAEQLRQMQNIPLPDQHLASQQYFKERPLGAAASSLDVIRSMYSSSYSKDIYGVELTFSEHLQKLASADSFVSGLHGLVLNGRVPSRQLQQLLSQNLSAMAKALSKGISMLAISQDVPWCNGATAIDTMGALTGLLGHMFAASAPTSTGGATSKPHLLAAQQLAKTGLLADIARACSSTAATLTEALARKLPAGYLQHRIEFAGVLLRLFVQLASHWPGRALAGNTISQCAEAAAKLAAAVLKLGGDWPGTTFNAGCGNALRGNVAGAWPAPRQYAFSVAHVLVKELCAEARLAIHGGSFDLKSSQLSRVTKTLLGSASMWYLLSAHLAVGVMKLREQQHQSQNPKQPQSQTLQPHHLQLLHSLDIDPASLGPDEVGQWPNIHDEWASWSDMMTTLVSAVAKHTTVHAGEGSVPQRLPCRAVIPVMVTLLELSQCAQGSQVLWDTIHLVHKMIDMCLSSAGHIRFEDKGLPHAMQNCCRAHESEPAIAAAAEAVTVNLFKPVLRLLPMLNSTMQDSITFVEGSSSSRILDLSDQQQAPAPAPGVYDVPKAWVYAALVSRLVPQGAIPSGPLLGPCDRDLIPALEVSVRAAAEYCEWARATGERWAMYGRDCDSNCITTGFAGCTLMIAAATEAPRHTPVGGSLGRAYNIGNDAHQPSDDAVDWRPLHSYLITCLKAISQHHSKLNSTAALNRARAVAKLLQMVATSEVEAISNSEHSIGEAPASWYRVRAVHTTLLTARALIAAGKLLLELCKQGSAESSKADSQPDDCGSSDGVAEFIAKVMLPSVADACCWVAQHLQQMTACSPRPSGTLAGVLLKLADDGQHLAASITAAATELGSLGDCESLQDSSSSNGATSATKTCASHVSMTLGVQAHLQNSIGPKLQSFGSAVCAQLPVGHCCNNPGCVITSHMSEQALVGGKGCVCSGCRVARYCGTECQTQHWPEHRTICKKIKVARRAATSHRVCR